MKSKDKVALQYSFEEVFKTCLMSINRLNKWKIVTSDYFCGVIHAKVGLNWESFGERIEIKLTEEGETITIVEIESRSALPTLFDNGRNKANINEIIKSIKKNLYFYD